MRKRITLTICLVLTTVALVAGCTPALPEPSTAPSATVEPTADPMPSPESLDETLDRLREQVAGTSVGCDDWVLRTEGPAGSVSGICDGVWTLFVFDTLESRNTVLTLNQGSMEPARFIVGPGWLITSDEATAPEALDALGAELGYPVWSHTDPIPES